jgi:DNA-binding response OmpR family regulator
MGAWRASTILCIGDDPLRLNLRCSFLKANGWRVLSAGSGYEGIIRCGQESIDVVVLDLNSGGSESALVTGELKRLRPKLLVIMLVSEERDVATDATKQADVVIPRSASGEELLRALSVLTGA